MRLLGIFPGVLHYSKFFLRLEPIGLELVAQAARQAGHQVKLIDLQVEDHRAYFRTLERWRPDVIAFSCNYLPHVPDCRSCQRDEDPFSGDVYLRRRA